MASYEVAKSLSPSEGLGGDPQGSYPQPEDPKLRNKPAGQRESWFHNPPSDTDKQQETAEGENDEAQGHGLLAAQAVNNPESHKDTCKGEGAPGEVALT